MAKKNNLALYVTTENYKYYPVKPAILPHQLLLFLSIFFFNESYSLCFWTKMAQL